MLKQIMYIFFALAFGTCAYADDSSLVATSDTLYVYQDGTSIYGYPKLYDHQLSGEQTAAAQVFCQTVGLKYVSQAREATASGGEEEAISYMTLHNGEFRGPQFAQVTVIIREVVCRAE